MPPGTVTRATRRWAFDETALDLTRRTARSWTRSVAAVLGATTRTGIWPARRRGDKTVTLSRGARRGGPSIPGRRRSRVGRGMTGSTGRLPDAAEVAGGGEDDDVERVADGAAIVVREALDVDAVRHVARGTRPFQLANQRVMHRGGGRLNDLSAINRWPLVRAGRLRLGGPR